MKLLAALALILAPACVALAPKQRDPATLATPDLQLEIGRVQRAMNDPWQCTEAGVAYLGKLRTEYAARRTDWPAETREAIAKGQLVVGMTPEQLLISWGEPRDVNHSASASGTSEQWCYGGGSSQQFIYFENGLLVGYND